MNADRWRMGFHIMPPTGWLNDPNGLCHFRGVYHVFFQYSPTWPEPHAPRGWGHATSCDLVTWEQHGMAIAPELPEEASGAYSGSAAIVPGAASDGGDLMRLYYTGNVKLSGNYDYIHAGREANEIRVESEDGFTLSPKQVFMRNADYPSVCSCHVRDPKVWRQDGVWWMLLGARDLFDKGMALIYRSDDGLAWTLHRIVRPTEAFGFMWECPDRVALDGAEYLSICPQGMADHAWSGGLRDVAGYIPLAAGERLIDAETVDPDLFERWDSGFDFYAPQTFVDGEGRTILIGWMGMPEAPYTSAPAGMTWCHCLTVPRVLSRRADGGIAQVPVPELAELRGEPVELAANPRAALGEHRADVVVEGVEGPFTLTLDGVLEVSWSGGELVLRFLDAVPGAQQGLGAGRTERRVPLERLDTLRVLVDSSAVEVFANDGARALATRWFPVAENLTVSCAGTCAHAVVYPMGDGMRGTYA